MTNMTTRNNVRQRCKNIIKSRNDDRLYRGLVLNNKMKVLLISDPVTDKSAVALNVKIGSMCDPDDLPGLAHFCEHMLLLESDKYRMSMSYKKYLSDNSGVDKSTTHSNHTMYYFDVKRAKLMGALKRFARLFVAPLFTESLTELEVHNIHSEYLEHWASDTWRLNQLIKSSTNLRHPYFKFSIGNKETLDVVPKQMGINIRQRLLEFYEKYYSANVMSLCVLGIETLDDLENTVVQLFSRVRNKEIDIPICSEHPFDDEHFRTRWFMVPVENITYLHVIFPLPNLEEHCRSKSVYYISHLLVHKGKGSILAALKRRGWCNSLFCEKRPKSLGFWFFFFEVNLTEEGLKHVDDIITLMFRYINMLKKQGPVEWIYKEYRDLADINFRFMKKQDLYSYVSSRAFYLWNTPMEEILCQDILFPQWTSRTIDYINTIMKYLTPQNIRVYVIAKACESVVNETEYWYGTKFKKEKISPEIIDMWENAGYNSEFHLPAKNEFIPSRLNLKPRDDIVIKYPTIIKDTQFVRMWFKRDSEFLVPKAKMYFQFVSPYMATDPVSLALSTMHYDLLQDSLIEYVYLAHLGGLHWSFKYTQEGVVLSIYGYDDKQQVLLEKIVNRMLNFKIDPEKFNIRKEYYIKYWNNCMAYEPYRQVDDYLKYILNEAVYNYSELLHALTYLTVDRFQAFIPQLFSKMHVECLIHGNIMKKEALDIATMIESKLNSAIPHIMPLWQHQLGLHREVKLDDGRQYLFQMENKFHKSSCTAVYYQIDMQSVESSLLLELLAQIIEQPCSVILRTREQSDYKVFSNMQKLNVMQGLTVMFQGNKHPRYLEKLIDSFMRSMLVYISTMSEEKFEEHKNYLVTLRINNSKELFLRTNMFWNEIIQQKYNFDRANIEMDYLMPLTQEHFLNFFKENIHSKARRKLSLHIISTIRDNDESEMEYKEFDNMLGMGQIIEIKDASLFKCSQFLNSALEPYMHKFPKKGISSFKL